MSHNRTLWYATAGLTVLTIVSVFSPLASAGPTGNISGTFAFTFTSQTVTKVVGGNTFISFTFSEVTTGSVAGTRVGSGTLTIHANGNLTAQDSGTYTGTILGVSGSCTASTVATGSLAALTGNVVFTACSGGLAGVHGVAKAVGAATSATTLGGTYTGHVN